MEVSKCPSFYAQIATMSEELVAEHVGVNPIASSSRVFESEE